MTIIFTASEEKNRFLVTFSARIILRLPAVLNYLRYRILPQWDFATTGASRII